MTQPKATTVNHDLNHDLDVLRQVGEFVTSATAQSKNVQTKAVLNFITCGLMTLVLNIERQVVTEEKNDPT